jgi:hypothetical protein
MLPARNLLSCSLMLYDLHEVSEAVGLSLVTPQSYTSRGRSDLVRGVDFFVRRTSPCRRQLMITDRGFRRLQTRAYRVFGDVWAPSRQFIWNGREKPPPIKGSPQERRMRLKQLLPSSLAST